MAEPAPLARIAGDDPPAGAEAWFLEREDGRTIRFMTAPARGEARGAVLVSPGRCEFIEKYFEAARELQAKGFAVFVTDHYGQGLSDRPLKDRLKGHIDSFDTYVADLKAMAEAAALPAPRVLLGHSMGGAIAALALARGALDVRACALSAPMFGVSGLAPGATIAASLAVLFGMASRYIPGRGDEADPPSYDANMVTHDHRRFDRMVRYYEADRRLMLGAPTFGWVEAALRAIGETRRPGFAESITAPVLIASAGDESLVSNRAQERFAARAATAQLVDIPNARHEILMERDPARARFWQAFDALLARAGI